MSDRYERAKAKIFKRWSGGKGTMTLEQYKSGVMADAQTVGAGKGVDIKGFKFKTQIGILRLRGFLKSVDRPAIEPWSTLIARNSVPRTPPRAPLLIAQGGKDVIVAPDVTREYAKGLCKQGKKLRFLWMPSMEHPQSARDTAAQTIDWFDDRFAGKPEADDCGGV